MGSLPWGIQSLGTDFDGIIDPIDGYWTAEQIDYLDDYLLMHAYNYVKEIKPLSFKAGTKPKNRT